MLRRCFQCEQENAQDQSFCGRCGSSLLLADFLAAKVQQQLELSFRDRNVVETEAAIRVFERAWGWVKIVGSIAGVVLLLGGVLLTWRVHDLNSAVSEAKDAVSKTSDDARGQISQTSVKSLAEIRESSGAAQQESRKVAGEVDKQSEAIRKLGSKATAQFSDEAASVKSDVEIARGQIKTASELEPEMKTMQDQLALARKQLEAQQTVLSSSEDFVKHVFSTHALAVFDLNGLPSNQYVVIPPPTPDIKNTVLYVLLPAVPITGTMQLQFRIFLQPPTSYFTLHNLLIFFWGDPPEGLKQGQFTASYFPDSSDKEIIHSLAFRDGRVFADDEPLIKFGQPDPDFHGSKWIRMMPSAPVNKP